MIRFSFYTNKLLIQTPLFEFDILIPINRLHCITHELNTVKRLLKLQVHIPLSFYIILYHDFNIVH